MKPCQIHSFKKIRTGPKTIHYRCSECGKGKRRYRPGHKPASKSAWVW